VVKLKPEFDVSTITSGFDGSLLNFVRKFQAKLGPTCCVFKTAYGIKTMSSIKLKWSISGSAGPNGSPAYSKFIEDTYAILMSPLSVKIFFLFRALPVINKEDTGKSITDTI
jgi:hypothetical protein